MHLSPREIDKLLLHGAGFLAQQRYARGLRLNYPESMALLASQLLEFIREGARVAELMDRGKRILGLTDVMPGVAEMLREVQVEGTFPDGTKLVTVHDPICRKRGDPALALFGSGIRFARKDRHGPDNSVQSEPGASFLAAGDIEINAGRNTVRLTVTNLGDRPIQVGSHYPFFETNASLRFDRAKAYGRRLDIPSGTAVRFEPGEEKEVDLIPVAGQKILRGGNALATGRVSAKGRRAALIKARRGGFLGAAAPEE